MATPQTRGKRAACRIASAATTSPQGALRGAIGGRDFADAFFAIWFGDDPPNPGLKSGLLGGPCG